jgi:hypothetical protein
MHGVRENACQEREVRSCRSTDGRGLSGKLEVRAPPAGKWAPCGAQVSGAHVARTGELRRALMLASSLSIERRHLEGEADGRTLRRRLPRKIRYTKAEWEAITQRARLCGKPPARYVREVSLGAAPRPRSSQANAELIRELGRVGTVLTQLAATARQGRAGLSADAIDATLADILSVVRRLG